jgi:hypothetical protein
VTVQTPNLLSHYTDLAGLAGIVRSKQIWCSNIRFLNDSKEYAHGLEAIANSFEAATSGEGKASAKLKAFVRAGLLDMLRRLAGTPEGLAPCVASLTTLSDDLSQWRGYGGSPGICIRFDGQSLEARVKDSGAYLFPCFYRERDLLDMVQDVNDLADGQQLDVSAQDIDSFVKAVGVGIDEVVNFCHKSTCLFKAQAFAAEHEWRILIEGNRDRVNFRQRGGVIIPYVPIDLWSESSQCPIREIGIGPGEHQKLNEAAIRLLLDANDLDAVATNISNIPFRKFF